MTAVLSAPVALPAAATPSGQHASDEATPAVLTVSGLPRHLRLRVESLISEHLSEPAVPALPAGTDIWDIPWFTRWRPDPPRVDAAGRATRVTVSCREVITGSVTELDALAAALTELAQTFRFTARVTVNRR